MAREVIIRILEERPSEPDPEASDGGQSDPSRTGKSKKDKTLSQLLTAYVGKRVWGIIKEEAKYFTGKYFAATENYKTQSLVDNALETIDFGMSTGFSMVAGAKMFEGTALGAGGGALLAAAAVITQKTVTAFNRYFDEAQKIINNTYGNYFYGERAGYVDGGHGTEN